MRRIILLVFILFAGCSHNTFEEFSSNITLKANEKVDVGQGVSIVVNNISDSRCPEGCMCFWAGEARVYFTISNLSSSLDTNLVLPSQINFADYSVSLISVDPYPKCDFANPVTPLAKFLIEHQK